MVTLRFALFVSSLALAGSALADFQIFSSGADTRSLFKNTSGFLAGYSATGFDAYVYNSSAPTQYVNSLSVTKGAGFDPNIQYTVSPTLGGYVLGSAITSGSFLSLNDLVSFDVNSGKNAALGKYDLSIQFLGGTSPTATGILETLKLHVEVADALSISVTGSATPITVPGTLTSSVSMSVKNNMARDYVKTGEFIGGYSDGLGHNLSGDFDKNGIWYTQAVTVTPGGTVTGGQSIYTATAATPGGIYKGFNGILGGLYSGDRYYDSMDASSNIIVRAVPEPASFAVLGLGAIGLLRRRKA